MESKPQSGFTLIEVLVAMAILAIGLLAVSSLQGTSARGNMTARTLSRAVNAGESQLETLMTRPYANCTDGNATLTVGGKTYALVWNISENATQHFKDVHLVVQWDNNSNITFDFVKSTMLE